MRRVEEKIWHSSSSLLFKFEPLRPSMTAQLGLKADPNLFGPKWWPLCMIHNTNTGCIFPLHVRFQQWPRWSLSRHHTAVINRWPQLPTDEASKFLPKLAPTDVNENRTQITSNFCRFHSIFYRFSSTDARTKKKITSNFCCPPNHWVGSFG